MGDVAGVISKGVVGWLQSIVSKLDMFDDGLVNGDDDRSPLLRCIPPEKRPRLSLLSFLVARVSVVSCFVCAFTWVLFPEFS